MAPINAISVIKNNAFSISGDMSILKLLFTFFTSWMYKRLYTPKNKKPNIKNICNKSIIMFFIRFLQTMFWE